MFFERIEDIKYFFRDLLTFIGMRKAMAEALVGDDVFREDPTVLELEKAMAKELGKEAGLFVPTGSMGNLICVMVHCWGRGLEIILGDRSHIHVYEQGTIAQFGGGQ